VHVTDPADRVALTGIEAAMLIKNRSCAHLYALLACVAVPGCDMFESDADDSGGTEESGTDDDDGGSTDAMSDTGAPTDLTPADETGPDPDSGPDSDTSPPGDALGDSVFLYIHADGDYADSVHAYDVDAQQTWLVTDFGGNTELSSIAIHPDRTSIAVSAFYQLSDAAESEGIWRVPLGGGEPESIMAALPGEDGVLNGVDSLAYTPDGAYVYFDHATFDPSTSVGGGTLARVADGGGLPELFLDSNGTCALNAAPSPSPDGSQLFGVRSVCTDSTNEGLVAYAAPPTDVGQVAFPADGSYGVQLVSPEWLSDGSGVLFVVNTLFDLDGDGNNDGQGDTVLLLSLVDGQVYILVPPADDQHIRSFALSPDDSRMILCLDTVDMEDLVLVDFTGEAPTYTALTNDGNSCDATW
jgi:hypothetical protein